MTLARHSPILLLLALAGCCGPAISGRYCHADQAPHAPPCGCDTSAHVASACQPGCGLGGHGAMLHGPGLAGFVGVTSSGAVPVEQHADYVSPLPKFHPVPTRPVFEPLPTNGPPLMLDVSK